MVRSENTSRAIFFEFDWKGSKAHVCSEKARLSNDIYLAGISPTTQLSVSVGNTVVCKKIGIKK